RRRLGLAEATLKCRSLRTRIRHFDAEPKGNARLYRIPHHRGLPVRVFLGLFRFWRQSDHVKSGPCSELVISTNVTADFRRHAEVSATRSRDGFPDPHPVGNGAPATMGMAAPRSAAGSLLWLLSRDGAHRFPTHGSRTRPDKSHPVLHAIH